MYIPKTLQEENVHSNCLMGLIFSTSWRVGPKKKNSIWGSGFFEFCMQKYRILRKEFLSTILWFLEFSFKGISFVKFTPYTFLSKILSFPGISFKGISFIKLNPPPLSLFGAKIGKATPGQ